LGLIHNEAAYGFVDVTFIYASAESTLVSIPVNSRRCNMRILYRKFLHACFEYVSYYFYCNVRPEGLLCDAELDLLVIPKFLVSFISLLTVYPVDVCVMQRL